MLAIATSSSSSGAAVIHCGQPLGEHQRVVAEHQAVDAEVGRVDAVGHGRVDAGERVVEPGAERPLPLAAVGVVQRLVDGFLVRHAPLLSGWISLGAVRTERVAEAAHMWGTFSGIS